MGEIEDLQTKVADLTATVTEQSNKIGEYEKSVSSMTEELEAVRKANTTLINSFPVKKVQGATEEAEDETFIDLIDEAIGKAPKYNKKNRSE